VRRFVQTTLALAMACAAVSFAPRAARGDDRIAPATAANAATAPRTDESDAETGRVVVGLDPAREEHVVAAVERLGGTVETTPDGLSVAVLEPPDEAHAGDFADQLAELPGVDYAEVEHFSYASSVPPDPGYPMQWGLERIGLPIARDWTKGSPSVVVAVVDSGLARAHLDGPIHVDWANGFDFVDNDAAPDDTIGHGTHVAGTIAAATDNILDFRFFGMAGIAPNVTILPIRVLGANGQGANSKVAAGIVWAADHGADVINLSLGSPEDDSVVRNACSYAVSRGCVVVAASGNDSSGSVAYPGCYPGVVGVGAIGFGNALAPFSQYGPDLDFVAPGEGIWSLALGTDENRWGVQSGTSMAAPHVSGVAALVRSVSTTWTAEMVAQTLAFTAQDLGAANRDDRFGFGLVRADSAVAFAAQASDDRMPGIPAPSRRVEGTLDQRTDPNDVHFLRLNAGETLRATLTSADPAFGLRLLSAGQTLESNALGWASGSPGSPTKSLTFAVSASAAGTYCLDVRAPSGAGAYRIDYTVIGTPTVVSASAPSTSAWRGRVTMTGVLRRAVGGFVPSRQVRVEARPSGSRVWTVVGQATTSPSGGFSVLVRPKRKTEYRAVFSGEDGVYLNVTSARKTITPRAYLTSPKVSKRIRKGRSFTAAGQLRPMHGAGKKTVKILAYRKVKGKYRYVKSFSAVNKRYTSATSKYSGRIRLSSKGKWKLVAKVKGDSMHATTSSSARYLTVK